VPRLEVSLKLLQLVDSMQVGSLLGNSVKVFGFIHSIAAHAFFLGRLVLQISRGVLDCDTTLFLLIFFITELNLIAELVVPV
jgi:hypothetical protein